MVSQTTAKKGMDMSDNTNASGAPIVVLVHGAFADARVPGPNPERRSYSSFASFNDPDGNGWMLQEITNRLPGR
jgi:hypothetical protein